MGWENNTGGGVSIESERLTDSDQEMQIRFEERPNEKNVFPPSRADFLFFECSKTKGGTLGRKKLFFQKCYQISTRIGLKIPKIYFRNKNMFKNLFWPMQPCARSVHASFLLSKPCTERAQGCMGQNTWWNIKKCK